MAFNPSTTTTTKLPSDDSLFSELFSIVASSWLSAWAKGFTHVLGFVLLSLLLLLLVLMEAFAVICNLLLPMYALCMFLVKHIGPRLGIATEQKRVGCPDAVVGMEEETQCERTDERQLISDSREPRGSLERLS